MNIMKRFFAFLISFLLVISMLSGIVLADEDYAADMVVETDAEVDSDNPISNEIDSIPIAVEEETAIIDPDDVGDNNELLIEYMEISMSTSDAAMYSTLGLRHLTGIDVKVYGLLKTCAAKVADGEVTSTVFAFTMSDLGLGGKYTAADLGVSAVVSDGAITEAGKAALKAKLEAIHLSRIVTALLFDCPAEFYWYEKTVGSKTNTTYGIGATYDSSLGEYVLYFSDSSQITFSFAVAEDYAVDHASGTYVVDSGVIETIQTALDHANTIITSHVSETDYEKLVSYKDEICDAVSYNTTAGNHNYTYNYGNPWQIIWVFDEDASTNVVCEGYSKAFQFLCDGSEFENEMIQSRLVTGTMTGGTGAGGHMWNVVTMEDGKNYLVDVTNCDGGTIGSPDKLFLVGDGNGSVSGGYSIDIPGQYAISYEYDSSTLEAYEESEIVLAAENYDPDSVTPIEHVWESDYRVDKEATCTEEGVKSIHCSECGIVKKGSEVTIPATGHSYGNWSVTKAATCTATGTQERTCSACGNKETQTIAAKGHTWKSDYTVDKAATCTAEGSKSIHCSVCDAKKDGSAVTIPTTGHAYGSWNVTKEATCTAAGTQERVCSACGNKETQTIAAKGHTWEKEYTVDKAATCTAEGSKSIHCSVCDTKKDGSIVTIPATGHDLTHHQATAADYDHDGNSEYWSCSRCKKYFSDKDGKNEIAENSWVIPNKKQKYGNHTGLMEDEGTLVYLKNGKLDTSFSGILQYKDGWYYVKNGYVDTSYDSVESNQYGWWRIEKGIVNFNFNGLAANQYGTWYLKNGKVDFNYTGFAAGVAKNESGWWYVEGGQVKFNKSDILSGKANTAADKAGVDGWWYIVNSKVYTGNTVANNAYGWWAVRNGKVDFNYTGFASNQYGWWYAEKGQVTFNKNDILPGIANTDPKAAGEDGWWLVKKSQVVKETTVASNAYGWWYVKDGKVVFTHNGVEPNAYGWWCIHNGKVDFAYTGFEKNAYGWWYIEKGQVTFKKNDILSGKANTDPKAAGKDGWWLIEGSNVKKKTTVASNAYGWWYVKDGAVDFGYTGLAKNDYGTWYIRNGQVDFGFNGKYNGKQIVNGKVQ